MSFILTRGYKSHKPTWEVLRHAAQANAIDQMCIAIYNDEFQVSQHLIDISSIMGLLHKIMVKHNLPDDSNLLAAGTGCLNLYNNLNQSASRLQTTNFRVEAALHDVPSPLDILKQSTFFDHSVASYIRSVRREMKMLESKPIVLH